MEQLVNNFIDFMALLIASIWIVVALKLRISERAWIVVVTAFVILYSVKAVAVYLLT